MFFNTESKVSFVGEVLSSEFVLLDLKTSLEELFCLIASYSHMH